jgi:hypothetical protein
MPPTEADLVKPDSEAFFLAPHYTGLATEPVDYDHEVELIGYAYRAFNF